MSKKLRNITVTLDEKVARWARIDAARRDRSVSRLVVDLLRPKMRQSCDYEEAMKRALACKPFGKSDEGYLTREEVHWRAQPQ